MVHLNNNISKGMVLQAGGAIGSITNTSEDIIIEALISEADRPRIDINQEVEVVVQGLSQSEYGVIVGKVTKIDEDATIDQEKGNIFFKIKVEPNKNYVVGSKGQKVILKPGMVTETRVKYEKISYMQYFAEKLGFKAK